MIPDENNIIYIYIERERERERENYFTTKIPSKTRKE
jgi:hypothetical protein